MPSGKTHRGRRDDISIPKKQFAWPLFGSGLDNLGVNRKPIEKDVPDISDVELLMRIDAVSLCFTDVKEINLGETHPRLKGRDLKSTPIIPGHEVSLTVVGVGSELRDQYNIGQRFTLQPDVWVNGKSIPFSFGMDGGYRQFAIIDKKILEGDAGNYLIPVPEEMSYAAAAITEPWACVEASFRLNYRTTLKKNGNTLLYGKNCSRTGFQIDETWVINSKPSTFYVCEIPQDLDTYLQKLCDTHGIKYEDVSRSDLKKSECYFDDIILLDDAIGDALFLSEKTAKQAIIAFMGCQENQQKIEIDVGRLHYDDLFYVGTDTMSITDAYTRTPVNSEFTENGVAFILGAGGPMGRMFVQRAIEASAGPQKIITSNVTPTRVQALKDFFIPLARKHKKEIFFTNPELHPDEYKETMQNILKENGGANDIEVMVNKVEVIEEACQYLAPKGVVNIFAGMKRGVTMSIDPNLIAGEMQIRFIGHSGSDLDDQKAVINQCRAGELDTNLSVAAIGGLSQISEGVQAMMDSAFPGKIVIFPQVLSFPLTGLDTLSEILPEVAEKLGENNTWNIDVENAFLESQQ